MPIIISWIARATHIAQQSIDRTPYLVRELVLLLLLKLVLIFGIHALYFSDSIDAQQVNDIMSKQWGLTEVPAQRHINIEEQPL